MWVWLCLIWAQPQTWSNLKLFSKLNLIVSADIATSNSILNCLGYVLDDSLLTNLLIHETQPSSQPLFRAQPAILHPAQSRKEDALIYFYLVSSPRPRLYYHLYMVRMDGQWVELDRRTSSLHVHSKPSIWWTGLKEVANHMWRLGGPGRHQPLIRPQHDTLHPASDLANASRPVLSTSSLWISPQA